ncbi:MAG: hypothetical protein AAGD25_35405 [Cyanobacteria bacterium P01_F01_bin.150]
MPQPQSSESQSSQAVPSASSSPESRTKPPIGDRLTELVLQVLKPNTRERNSFLHLP